MFLIPPLFSFPFPATTAEAKRRPFRRKAKDEEGEWKRKKKRARLRCTFPVSLQGPIKRHKKGPPLSQLNADNFFEKKAAGFKIRTNHYTVGAVRFGIEPEDKEFETFFVFLDEGRSP